MGRVKKTQTEIVRAIGVSQVTVSKELKRSWCSDGRYSAKMAQMFADMMKERSHQYHKLDESRSAFICEDKRNGGEFSKNKLIPKKLNVPVFFTALYSPGRSERWKTQTNLSGSMRPN